MPLVPSNLRVVEPNHNLVAVDQRPIVTHEQDPAVTNNGAGGIPAARGGEAVVPIQQPLEDIHQLSHHLRLVPLVQNLGEQGPAEIWLEPPVPRRAELDDDLSGHRPRHPRLDLVVSNGVVGAPGGDGAVVGLPDAPADRSGGGTEEGEFEELVDLAAGLVGGKVEGSEAEEGGVEGEEAVAGWVAKEEEARGEGGGDGLPPVFTN